MFSKIINEQQLEIQKYKYEILKYKYEILKLRIIIKQIKDTKWITKISKNNYKYFQSLLFICLLRKYATNLSKVYRHKDTKIKFTNTFINIP